MKVNFDIKDGVANISEADQALAGIIKNFNVVNKKFQKIFKRRNQSSTRFG